MTDYNKLTVVKLKEELKQRGLQQTGLKAALVARLTECDAQSAAAPPSGAANVASETPEVTEDHRQSQETLPNRNGSLDAASQKLGDAPGPEIEASEVEQVEKELQAPPIEPTPTVEVRKDEKDIPSEQHLSGLEVEDGLREAAAAQVGKEHSIPATPEISADANMQGDSAVPRSVEILIVQTDAPTNLPASTQASVTTEEVMEDSRKRKRRSKSPMPSTEDVALKKAKALDGSPVVKLPEDREPVREENETTMAEDEPFGVVKVNGESSKDMEMEEPREDEPETSKDVEMEQPREDEPEATKVEATEKESSAVVVSITEAPSIDAPATENQEMGTKAKEAERKPSAALIDTLQSPVKASSSDTRFRGLFSASKPTEAAPAQEPYPDTEDRDISPALHPATSALYIRNFMRPLQPHGLKEHLAALARPPNSLPSGEIITDFFLDTIRSHCLIRFTTVTAASRVRTALHDRAWPDEKTRKPLWIDFVPEEKLQKWIEVEQASAVNKNQPIKRWEVVYEQEDGGVTAYLQEADGTGPPRTFFPNGQRADFKLQPVDTRPLTPVAPKPTGDPGKGFKALDDLFKSTDAKPKLYYLPVSEDTANRRLDTLAAGRGGGRSDEMRRFSFEEERIVDKGPEFGAGWRGGRGGGRGGYSGGYGRGGEGGYRGGRGDSWRGR